METKKLALIRILQILQKHSDFDHPLTQREIAEHLSEEYDIVLERKAVGRNLALLKEAGYDIESPEAGGGFFLAARDFTDAEIRLLIDAVLSSKHVSAKYSKDLIAKLCALSNKFFRSHVKHVRSVDEWDRTENSAVFLNMELIDEAITQGKQLHYDYNKYGADKKLHKSSQQYVSPYQMILHNQRYYLMAYSEYWHNMVFHRLDRITNMSVTEKRATPIGRVPGYRDGINYKTLSNSMPYMYTDSQQEIEFIADPAIIDQIIDWFGKEIRIVQSSENEVRVNLTASPRAMEHWAMQYANYVRVLSPAPLVKQIKENLKNAAKQYGE